MSNLRKKAKLDTVTVWELMGNNFFIPDYQRGYRWTKFEVEKLLEDLYAYIKKDKNGETFYCMQPLVVCFNESENAWEVIDGQQRLTTLFLMFSLKKERLQEDNPDLEIFNLSYMSRPDSEKFLKNIDFSKQNENIDYYHICEALKQIKSYYKPINSGKFVDSILNAKDEHGNPSVKFIWYDVTEEIKSNKVSSEEIFSRLNVGKIGLTNAELIKALFLNRAEAEAKKISSDEKSQSKIAETLKIKIANDWDMIEHSLQNDDFWSFIYGKDDDKYDTRIEFLFDLIKGKPENDEDNKYFTFDKYNEDFKEYDEGNVLDNSVEKKWKEVMDEFYLCKDWFDDKKLYHLIGYLRYKKIHISKITEKHDEAKSNSEFIKELRDCCVKQALNIKKDEEEDYNNSKENFVREKLNSYNYGETDSTIHGTLLLFNVLSVLDCEKSSARFSFKNFYDTKWDLEHISSQAPKDIDGDGKTDWILTNLAYFSGIKFDFENKDNREKQKKITDYKNKIKDELPKLEKEIIIKQSDINTISAKDICEKLLALLDSKEETTNSEIYKILSEYFNKDDSLKNIDSIGNLVLLDEGTNRGYKNAFFLVKRQWINSREKDGVYILPCTKNVFQKSYSTKLFDLMRWTNSDAEAYMEEMVKCLSKL